MQRPTELLSLHWPRPANKAGQSSTWRIGVALPWLLTISPSNLIDFMYIKDKYSEVEVVSTLFKRI